MKRRTKLGLRKFCALALLILLSPITLKTFAQQAAGAGKKSPPNPSTEAKESKNSSPKPAGNELPQHSKPTLSDFSWLEGKWQGAWGPRLAEQIWTGPKAGEMLGLFRVIENDKTLVIELLSISEEGDGIQLQFRHFTPSLVPWEKSAAAKVNLVELNAKSAVFENPSDGQPKELDFIRIDPDTYSYRSEIATSDDGTSHVTEIKYHRQK